MHKAQARWAGYVSHMSDCRIPKLLLYGELSYGSRKVAGQSKRYKDSLKAYLNDFNINVATWETTASDRPTWQNLIHKGAIHAANCVDGTFIVAVVFGYIEINLPMQPKTNAEHAKLVLNI